MLWKQRWMLSAVGSNSEKWNSKTVIQTTNNCTKIINHFLKIRKDDCVIETIDAFVEFNIFFQRRCQSLLGLSDH